MDCKTCKELRAVKDSEKSASITVHLHEAIVARLERTISRLCLAVSLSAIANIIICCAVFFNG